MNNAEEAHAIELPGESQSVTVTMPAGEDVPNTTVGSVVLPFDAVKSLLSSKPLRRPNRTKPAQ